MESFEQKIKERNNLLKSQVESLTGRNELTEVIDTLLKAGVSEEDLVEKAKYIRREADGKGGYKYIYSEPKENKIKTDKVDKKEGKNSKILNKLKDIKIKNLDISGANIENDIVTLTANRDVDLDEKLEISRAIGASWYGGTKAWGEKSSKLMFKLHKSESSDLEKAKADKKQQKKISKVMKEFKAGTLKTSSGEPVKDQKQAIAIAMSEAGMSVKKSTLSTVLKQVENDIEKSHLGEFSYSEKLGIKKTGKEIKEKFKANLQKEQSEASELKAKLGVLKTKIGEEPTKKCDYWGLDAYEDKGIDVPLVYDYSQMKGEEKMSPIAETLVVETESQPKENLTSLMYQYNDTVRKYIDCQKEILQINTILNNYKDTDVYQLTISQATVLGF